MRSECRVSVTRYPGKVTATGDTLIKWYSAQWKLNTPAKEHTYEILGDRIEGTAGLAVSKRRKKHHCQSAGRKERMDFVTGCERGADL